MNDLDLIESSIIKMQQLHEEMLEAFKIVTSTGLEDLEEMLKALKVANRKVNAFNKLSPRLNKLFLDLPKETQEYLIIKHGYPSEAQGQTIN